MRCMLIDRLSLSNINLLTFNTQNSINLGYMFKGCKSLININLSNFDSYNVTDITSIFYGCSLLSNLDIS